MSDAEVSPGFELSNAEKRDLKARAQKLEPVVRLGRSGLTAEFLQSMEAALTQRDLVKMKFGDHQDERDALAPEIAARTASVLVQQVGHVAVFYRPLKVSPGT